MKFVLMSILLGIVIVPTFCADSEIGPNDLWRFNSPMNFVPGENVNVDYWDIWRTNSPMTFTPGAKLDTGISLMKIPIQEEPEPPLLNGGGSGAKPIEPIPIEPIPIEPIPIEPIPIEPIPIEPLPITPAPLDPNQEPGEVEITSQELLEELDPNNNTSKPDK